MSEGSLQQGQLKLTLTGTGTSAGIPMIGCDCEVCTSDDPKDKRDRCGAMVEYLDEAGNPRCLLIDTPTDLRHQMVRHQVFRIDGVLYTHTHADHIFGIDDLRRFNAVMKEPINIYGEAATMDWLYHRFDYIFQPHTNVNKSFIAQLIQNEIEVSKPLDLFGQAWLPIRLMHGNYPILGYRVGGIAYCTDVSHFPEETIEQLDDLDVLVIDALRYREHPTHQTVDQATAMVEKIKPKLAIFTHIAHDIKHADLSAKLPDHIKLGYDGMAVTV